MTGIPEPWASILGLLTGPYGVVVGEAVVIFFLWRLFREATGETAKSQNRLGEVTQALKDLTTSFNAWRETTAFERSQEAHK